MASELAILLTLEKLLWQARWNKNKQSPRKAITNIATSARHILISISLTQPQYACNNKINYLDYFITAIKYALIIYTHVNYPAPSRTYEWNTSNTLDPIRLCFLYINTSSKLQRLTKPPIQVSQPNNLLDMFRKLVSGIYNISDLLVNVNKNTIDSTL